MKLSLTTDQMDLWNTFPPTRWTVEGHDVIGPLPLHLASLADVVWDEDLTPYNVEKLI